MMKNPIQIVFTLGSEWLYYKIYCGLKTSDVILTEKLKPLVDDLLQKGLIDKFFFIRYTDPAFHIRVRFHIPVVHNIIKVILLFNQKIEPLLLDYLVSQLQTDVYTRELRRYGENSMVWGEDIFFIDSYFVLNFLDLLDFEEGEELRWLFSLKIIDHFLDGFDYSLQDKSKLLETLSAAFMSENGTDSNLSKQLNSKYRAYTTKIKKCLEQDDFSLNIENSTFIDLLNQKLTKLETPIKKIKELKCNNQLEVDMNKLLSSFIHMSLNRIFNNRQRTHEMVIYYFLAKYYKSAIAFRKHQVRI